MTSMEVGGRGLPSEQRKCTKALECQGRVRLGQLKQHVGRGGKSLVPSKAWTFPHTSVSEAL